MGRAASLLAAHGIFGPQPGAGQDKDRGRAGGPIHDPACAFSGAAVIPGERGKSQLPVRSGRSRDHLKLRFVAEKPPPSHVFEQVALMAAEERVEYF